MIKKTLLVLTFSCLLIWLGYFTPRQSFEQLIGLYSALFIGYFFLIKTFKNAREVIFLGVFFRLLLLFAIPALSDDFYRFVWDGRLLFNGINPYTILPADFVQTIDFQMIIFDKTIFDKLNSPNYYTVYPPLNQLIFAASAGLAQGSLFGNVIVLRVFIVLAEISLLLILMKSKNHGKFNLYAFNPLIILELTGNLHFEGVVMCFLVLAFYVGVKSQKIFDTE